jgi:uncharacterized protein (DUF1501 family)
MKRREFIKNTGTASLAVPLTLNGLTLSAIPQLPFVSNAEAINDRVLVIVQLLGGNDGLNTVVPIDQYANLQKARPHVIIPTDKLLNVSSTVGFHPAITGLKSLYDIGNLGIVQSVGYPDQNRSHFRSIDIWRTGADSKEMQTTGWAGRYFDTLYPGYPIGFPNAMEPNPVAIAMGSFVSETCQGKIANYSLALNDPFNFSQVYTGATADLPAGNYGLELSFMRDAIKDSNAYASGITAAAKAGKNIVAYPDTDIAYQLKNVALMISGGMKTKIYVVTQDFFDTHAHQVVPGNPTAGLHANLLKNVSDAIYAFQNDLKAQGLEKRVIGVSLSEFGRQIKSNASLGTDHGTAAPLFLFGSCVKPQILGTNPVIPVVVPDQEGVAMQYDFRNVYGSLLQDWFGADISIVQDVFYTDFQHLDLISTECNLNPPVPSEPVQDTTTSTTGQKLINATSLKVYPNPTSSVSTVEFNLKEEEQVQVSVVDARGNQLKIISTKVMAQGRQKLIIDFSSYPSGNYFVRIVSAKGVAQAKGVVKL